MSEQTKAVLRELNAALGTKFDLIKFDALNAPQRLQVLADLLAHFDAGPKMDVAEEDAERVSVQLLEMLANVKYRPPPAAPSSAAAEPGAFRAQLLGAEPKLLLSILGWLLTNKEQVRNTAYLARRPQLLYALRRYLKLPDIPAEARTGGVAELLHSYRELVEEFKEVHRRTRSLAAADDSGAEMLNDIKEMAVERDIVIKRLENIQVNLIDVNEKEDLLRVSKELRLQQERANELTNQLETQENQLKVIGDQLKRYLNVFYGQSSTPKSAADVIKHLREEIQLNEYASREKLPAEVAAMRREVEVSRRVLDSPAPPTRADLARLQDQIGGVHEESEALVAERLAARAPADDKLTPFRQQAALIRRNKEAAGARAHQLAADLRDHEATLAALNAQVRQLLGEAVLRGDELKKYVNTLRHKSTLYKRQRATLSSHKVEAGVLTRTLYIIGSADPTLEVALLHHNKLRVDGADVARRTRTDRPLSPADLAAADLAQHSLHELSQMVAQAAQRVSSARQEIQPLAARVQPVRERLRDVQQQYEQRKRVYEATAISVSSQTDPLRERVRRLGEQLAAAEAEWARLRRELDKARGMQEAVADERDNSLRSPRRPSRMEALQRKIADISATISSLEEKQKSMSARAGAAEEQSQHWTHALRLLQCKLACAHQRAAAARAHASNLTITNKSQMLTLQ